MYFDPERDAAHSGGSTPRPVPSDDSDEVRAVAAAALNSAEQENDRVQASDANMFGTPAETNGNDVSRNNTNNAAGNDTRFNFDGSNDNDDFSNNNNNNNNNNSSSAGNGFTLGTPMNWNSSGNQNDKDDAAANNNINNDNNANSSDVVVTNDFGQNHEGLSAAKQFFRVEPAEEEEEGGRHHEAPAPAGDNNNNNAINNFQVVDLNMDFESAAAYSPAENAANEHHSAAAGAAAAPPPPQQRNYHLNLSTDNNTANANDDNDLRGSNNTSMAGRREGGGSVSLHSSRNSSRNASFSRMIDEQRRRVDLENELQAARLRFYDEVSGPSTLDFLRETGQAVFGLGGGDPAKEGGGGGGETREGEPSGSTVPAEVRAGPPPQTVLEKGLYVVTNAIDFLPAMLVQAVPSAVMSDNTKNLLFADFSNTLRNFFHTNILSMPFVLRQAGLVGGILLLSFVALTSEYATEAFFGAKNQMKRASSVVMYGDVPNMIWGGWYPMLSFFYGIIHLIGFLAFASSNARVLLAAMGLTGGWAMLVSMVVPSLLALPFVFFKRASSQPPLAVLGNIFIFASVVLMFVAFPYKPKEEEIKLWPSRPGDFFMALGVSVYAFTGVGSAIPVERTMQPRRYIRLLRVSIAVTYVVLLAFGLSGYLSFGSGTCSVMTVSLQVGPLKTAVSALLFVASVFIIPQQTFSFCELCDRRLLGIRYIPRYTELKPNILRVVSLVGSLITAYVVPYYGLILSISGSFGCGIVGLVVPAALDYVRRERWALKNRQTFSLRWWEYVVVFGLGAYGIVVVVVGVLFGMYNMWMTIQTGGSSTC